MINLFVESFWRDEAFSYLLAKRGVVEILALTARDFNPPLYYVFLHLWMMIAGRSEIALRLPSFMAYLGIIYVAYLFLTRIFHFSVKKAYLYLVLIAVNPLLITYAFEARMYTLLGFLATLSFYAYLTKNKRLYILTTTLGLFTHYFMILVVATQLIHARFRFKQAYITLGLLMPWALFVLTQKMGGIGSFWIAQVNPTDFFYLPTVLLTGYETKYGIHMNGLFKFSGIFVGILTIGTYFYLKKKGREKKSSVFSLLWLWSFGTTLLVFFISIYKPIYLPRYLIFATIGYLLLFIFLIDKMPAILKVVAWIIIFKSSLLFLGYRTQYNYKPDIRKPITEIKKLAGKNDLLYVTSELDYMVGQYYFYEDRVFIFGKTYGEIPPFVGKVLIPKESIRRSYPIYPAKAFVLKEDRTYDIRAVY